MFAFAAWATPGALEAQDAAPQAIEGTASPLAGLRRGRDGFIGARDYSAALGPARSIVEAQQTQREPQYPADLMALGLVEAELREFDDALEHLIDAADIVFKAEGEYSPTLIEYYRGLGRAYIKSAQYQQAIVILEQAQHISQRHLGLFNVEQAALLDDITTAYLGLGNTVDAQRMQLERLDNAVRRFGLDDPRVIPFRYTLARYYEQSRLPESAREQYEEVLKSQESRLGETDSGLLPPLREIVSLDLLVTQGADTEQRVTAVDRGLTLALLGDWALVTGDAATARSYYEQAWSALQTNPEVDVADYFRKPTMIDFVPPLSSVDRNERSRPYVWTEIVLEFDVSADGLPSDVRVVTRDQATTHYVRRYLEKDEEEALPEQ
jgi:tetratricopeptide (TPR) repeat protein